MDTAHLMTASGPAPVVPEPTGAPGHEREIAHELVRRTLIATPIAVVIAAVVAGGAGALGAVLGMAVVAGNFWFLAKVMTTSGRLGFGGAAAGAMVAYMTMLVVITLLALLVRGITAIDLGAFVLTIGIAHIVLLGSIVPRVGLTSGAPGLKPRPLSRRK
jgi:predicted phage tail protein